MPITKLAPHPTTLASTSSSTSESKCLVDHFPSTLDPNSPCQLSATFIRDGVRKRQQHPKHPGSRHFTSGRQRSTGQTASKSSLMTFKTSRERAAFPPKRRLPTQDGSALICQWLCPCDLLHWRQSTGGRCEAQIGLSMERHRLYAALKRTGHGHST